MKLCHSDEPLRIEGPSLFLAGPTPRSLNVESWRAEAVQILETISWTGTVLIPERHNWQADFDYLSQVEWEYSALEHGGAILFWVPRDVENLPGFTTNVEFGRYVGSGRVIYGRPDGCPHNRYLDWLYQKLTGQSPFSSLTDAIKAAAHLAESLNTDNHLMR